MHACDLQPLDLLSSSFYAPPCGGVNFAFSPGFREPDEQKHCEDSTRGRARRHIALSGVALRYMELYHSGTDDILGVCGDEETETGLAHTPRYEPSWFYQEVPSEMVDRCLRARSRGGIDEAAALWLHKHLVAFGHAANAHSCHFMAHSWFECAYGLKDGAPELISSINMRLRLGQATLAKQLYERVLQQREVPRKWVDGAQPLHSPACSRRDPDPNQANSDP